MYYKLRIFRYIFFLQNIHTVLKKIKICKTQILVNINKGIIIDLSIFQVYSIYNQWYYIIYTYNTKLSII